MFINIHSHYPPVTGEWAIQSLWTDFGKTAMPGQYSIGIHPWYIHTSHWENQLELLREASQNPHVLAIGECGLDKACDTLFSLQAKVFAAQVDWANEIGKPLIIHCVRAWEEVLQVLLAQGNKVPVVFHGFNKSLPLAQKIIGQGYYLSFGKSLEQPGKRKILSGLPADKIFLETDDSAISIRLVYEWAADALSIDHNSLVLQMQKNAAAIFGAAATQL